MTSHTRRALLGAVGAGVATLAGCSTESTTTPSAVSDADAAETSTGGASATASPETTVASAQAAGLPTADGQLPVMHSRDTLTNAVTNGGPPKNGIPSVDDPSFWTAAEAERNLAADDVVFGVVGETEAKAYPQHVLVWHEICNDVVDGRPVSVTYCPLTGTVLGFFRGETTFGVSGDLVNSNLVMYDRATDSRWPQVIATAISGPLVGASLTQFPVVWTTWKHWRDVHPDTAVLNEDTGYARNYGTDPYGSYTPRRGYYASGPPLFAPITRNDRFGDVDVVVGTRSAGVHAFYKPDLREEGMLAGGDLLAVYDARLEAAHVYRNPDGTSFEFVQAGGGSHVIGPDDEYAPDELPLDGVVAFDAMWFAWYGFYPETEVHTA